jgi:hypothetical protein
MSSQITDTTDQHTSVPSAARSTDCVDIASGTVLPVAQWTRYVHAVSGSGQTGRTSGKCSFVISFINCTVHQIVFRWSNTGTAEELLASPEALRSMQSVSYCSLSQLFLYTNRTDGRSTKAVCGFHRLIKRYKLCSHNQHIVMNTFIKQRPILGPNFTHHQAKTVQKYMNMETKIIVWKICTFTSSYIKNIWQECNLKTIHKIQKRSQKHVWDNYFSIKRF